MAVIITPGGSSQGAGSDPNQGPSAGASIHVDSDWKAQAQAEKERLAKADAERSAKQGAQPGTPGAAGAAHPGEFPPPDFRALVDMLAMQAVMYMGGMADRGSGRAIFDPEYSRHMIDLLGVLEDKTRGNITPEEAQDLKLVLNELRLRYVELMKLVAAQATGKTGVATPGTSGTLGGVAGPTVPGISSRT